METGKKSIGFGTRGWLLIVYQFVAFVAYTIFTNYPLNILSDQYNPMVDTATSNQQVAMLYTGGAIVGIIVQLIVSSFVGKMKSIKNFGIILGLISIILGFCISLIPMNINGNPNTLWAVCYFLINVIVTMWATFAIGILVGQWFPTRKGTVMGIATISFPVANAVIGLFAAKVFSTAGAALGMGAMTDPEGTFNIMAPGAMAFKLTDQVTGEATLFASDMMPVFMGFLPFLIIIIIAWLIGLIFIKDYPEQCGAFRDNDKGLSPEIAQKMMLEEIENKKTSCWKLGHTLACRDFWFITIPMGALLMFSVGMMTQTSNILSVYGWGSADGDGSMYQIVMLVIAICGAVGSFILGLIDTKLGTKKAIVISLVIMLLAGVLGIIPSGGSLIVSLICLGVFMGASSNFTVSAAAQYWRREDFGSVFATVNPIANVLAQLGPVVIAILWGMGMGAWANGASFGGNQYVFTVAVIVAGISIILTCLFSAKHVKEVDDKYRTKAGKPLDDALVGRK